MGDIELTQEDADHLIAMEKHRADEEQRGFPQAGESVSAPLVSADGREEFVMDLYRGRIDLGKVTYQTRARKVEPLVRLDLGNDHRNPDGEEVPGPHIHVYREGYGLRWAHAVDPSDFPNVEDLWEAYGSFLEYCRISRPPRIERTLFT